MKKEKKMLPLLSETLKKKPYLGDLNLLTCTLSNIFQIKLDFTEHLTNSGWVGCC